MLGLGMLTLPSNLKAPTGAYLNRFSDFQPRHRPGYIGPSFYLLESARKGGLKQVQ